MTCLTQAAPFLQMSPPPGGFGERGVGGGGGPLSHLYAGSPTSCFTSGLQAGLRQSHLNKVRRRPHQGRGPEGNQDTRSPGGLQCHGRVGGRGQFCSGLS